MFPILVFMQYTLCLFIKPFVRLCRLLVLDLLSVMQEMQGPRKFMTADGEVRFGNPVHLSEFLSEMHL